MPIRLVTDSVTSAYCPGVTQCSSHRTVRLRVSRSIFYHYNLPRVKIRDLAQRQPKKTTDLSFFLPMCFVNYPPRSLNETQPQPAACSECHLKNVQNSGYPLPSKLGPNPLIFDVFRRLRNLRVTLAANIFGTKHNIHTFIGNEVGN